MGDGVVLLMKEKDKEITQLKKEIEILRRNLADVEKSVGSCNKSNRKFEKELKNAVEEKKSEAFIHKVISDNSEMKYVLKTIGEMNKNSISRKQLNYWTKQIDMLRSEAAEIIAFKNEFKTLGKVEREIKSLKREFEKNKIIPKWQTKSKEKQK